MTTSIEMPCTDAAVQEKTGRTWTEWRQALDAADAGKLTHKELAVLVETMHSGGAWWSQTVAVGYERLTGKRAVGQGCDGQFAASASKSLKVSAAEAHACFVDPARRERWLEVPVVIRKATPPKSVRITWPDESSVEVWITEKGEAHCSLSVQHTKLPDEAAAAAQKAFWKDALDRLAKSLG